MMRGQLQRSRPIPPPPAGFALVDPLGEDREVSWNVFEPEGPVASNDFRTARDMARVAAEGDEPAARGGVNPDFANPALARQIERLEELLGGLERAGVLGEGQYRQSRRPRRGAAPGAPATSTFGLPPLPGGFELVRPGPINQRNPVGKRAGPAAPTPRNGVRAAERVPLIRNSSNEQRSIHDSGVQSSTVSKDQMPEAPTWNWSDEQKRAIQAQVAKVRSPEELDAFARALSRGRAGIGNAKDVLAHHKRTGRVASVSDVPQSIPNKNSDGAVGAAARGFFDPFNVLDEMGAFVDALGITPGRESIWNSDRSFGDILYGNIDENRSILQADERDHPGARFGGQIVSNVLLPIGNKARGAAQFAKWGAGQGALAGFGAGEGNPLERLPSTLLGTGVGATVGYGAGRALDILAPRVRGFMGRLRRSPEQHEFDAPPPPVGRPDSPDPQPQQLKRPSPQTPSRQSRAQEERLETEPPSLEMGPFGPINPAVSDDWAEAVRWLSQNKRGEVPGALFHPEVGDISMVWGIEGTGRHDGYGLAKLLRFHPDVVDDLPRLISEMEVVSRSSNRVKLASSTHRAGVRLDWDGKSKTWLITAFKP